MTQTVMAAKMAEKGITARSVALKMALSLFRNNGGTYEEAVAALDAAYADEKETKITFAARTMQERSMQVRNDAESGLSPCANKVDTGLPPSASPERSAGQRWNADKALRGLPDAAAKLPGHARRGATAISAVQATMAKSLFDSYHLPGDERGIGDVTWKELQGLARRHAEAFRLTSLIAGYAEASPDATVRDILKEETLREFINIARLSNVH